MRAYFVHLLIAVIASEHAMQRIVDNK